MQTTAELREGFLSFFEERAHRRFPSWSLIPPPEDPSTLFISAGMQPLKPYFSGAKQPPAPRFTTVQKVLRAGGKDTDLDEVGLTARHASMFEMLGNFSFGDYFKDGAIDFAWEFSTEQMGLDGDRIWPTVFAGDPALGLGEDEAAIAGWQRIGIPRERIIGLPRSENFWGPAGATGPCGPCSELNYDRGDEHGCGEPDCAPGCERCERFLEFWNLVFMEFDLAADGSLTPLPNQNIDTGMGLERGAMLLQEAESIFDTDGFQLIMDWIARESGVAYGSSPEATKAHRVISDHGRGMTFLAAEGITPSNEGRGYILRRLIRRAVTQARRIGLEGVHRLPAIVVEQVGPWYPEVVEHAETIERVVRQEEERFSETLERGLREFEELSDTEAIGGADAFRLAATYGFPIELTVELATERGQSVDTDGYGEEMGRHREISRAGAESGAQRAADFAAAAGFTSEFVGYAKTDVLTQIGALEELGEGLFLAKLRESPFYAAGGGQVTDAGELVHEETGATATLREAHRIGDDQALVFEGKGSPRAIASARSCRGRSGSRRWRTTRRRISSTRRCARCSASTSSRRARRSGPTSSASTSPTIARSRTRSASRSSGSSTSRSSRTVPSASSRRRSTRRASSVRRCSSARSTARSCASSRSTASRASSAAARTFIRPPRSGRS